MIYIIGFLAQICFSARLFFQWILSERAKRVESPVIFWALSLFGSCLLFFYGWLREDFAILLGQLISYYIYIWNLDMKNSWKKIPFIFRYLLLVIPFIAISYMLIEGKEFTDHFFHNKDITLPLLIWGMSGQVIFTLRFVYQWYYSQKRHESILPMGFWIISLTGSFLIITYAIVRKDPVLILGQAAGFILYARNIQILLKNKKQNIQSLSARS